MVFLKKGAHLRNDLSANAESSRTSPVSPLSPGPPRLSWRRRPDTHDSFEILRQPLAVTCDLLQVRAFSRVASEEASCKLLTVNWTNPGGNPTAQQRRSDATVYSAAAAQFMSKHLNNTLNLIACISNHVKILLLRAEKALMTSDLPFEYI
jgi:hypothetical protein